MTGIEPGKNLLLSSADSGCCSTQESPAAAGTVGLEYRLEGLTCGHCVQAVHGAVTALDGIDDVSIELVPGGLSRLVISGSASAHDVGAAITSAGYRLSN